MYEIKRLTLHDAAVVKSIVKLFRSSDTDDKWVQDFLINQQNYVIACLSGASPVGFLLAYELQRYDRNGMLYIHEVNVLPQYQREGIGKRLMEEAIRICKEKGLFKSFLITNKSNTAACGLYETTGAIATEDDNIVYWYEENILSGDR